MADGFSCRTQIEQSGELPGQDDGRRPVHVAQLLATALRHQAAPPSTREDVDMAMTVGGYLLSRLREWGVEHVFGYPGDGINGMLAAWADEPAHAHVRPGPPRGDGRVRGRRVREVLTAARGSASAWPRPGPARSTCSTGSTTPSSTTCRSWRSSARPARSAMGGSYQQEVDLLSLFKDVASDYVQMVTVPEQLPERARPGHPDRARPSARPTAIIIPSDVQELEYSAAGPRVQGWCRRAWASPGPTSTPDDDGDPPRGRHAQRRAGRSRCSSVRAPAAPAPRSRRSPTCSAPASAKALLGKDVLPDDLPCVTGSIGLLGTRPSYEMMMDCDTLLTVGSNFPYTQFMPQLGQARAVQIDIDGRFIGMRYPYEVNLVGDATTHPAGADPACCSARATAPGARASRTNVARWWETMQREAMVDADPINPMRLFWRAVDAAARRTRSSRPTPAPRRTGTRGTCRFRGDIRGSLSGTLATMGPGVPYAIGAKFAHPDRPAIAFVGDGAMQMNGMAELITIKKYWRAVERPAAVVAVLHNDDLNQVTWEMRAMEGAPKFVESQSLPDVDYAGFARSLGLQGIEVDKPDDARPGVGRRARRRPARPCSTSTPSPNVPPIPPHATFEQMKALPRRSCGGDEDRWSVMKEGIKTKLQEFLPHRRSA